MNNHNLNIKITAIKFDKNGNKIEYRTMGKANKSEGEIEIVKYFENGNIELIKKLPMRSFISQFLIVLRGSGFNATSTSIKTIDNGNTSTTQGNGLSVVAALGESRHGIVVGPNSASVSSSDNTFINRYLHAGGLIHQAVTFDANYIEDNEYKFKIKRVFTNNTGGSINIRETGLSGNGPSSGVLFARDTTDYTGSNLDIAIAESQSFEVRYVISVDTGSSFTENFAELTYGGFRYVNTNLRSIFYNGTTIQSSSYLLANNNQFLHWQCNHGTNVTGSIVVGTGNTLPTFKDFKLENLISAGTGADQLTYAESVIGPLGTEAEESSFTISRVFTNNSGNTITIREVGLYVNGDRAFPSGQAHKTLCILRELTGDIVLANEESTQLNIEISIQT